MLGDIIGGVGGISGIYGAYRGIGRKYNVLGGACNEGDIGW